MAGVTQGLLLTRRAAAAHAGLSARTLGRLVASGQFPAPIAVPGLQRGRYRLADIDAWLATLKASPRA